MPVTPQRRRELRILRKYKDFEKAQEALENEGVEEPAAQAAQPKPKRAKKDASNRPDQGQGSSKGTKAPLGRALPRAQGSSHEMHAQAEERDAPVGSASEAGQVLVEQQQRSPEQLPEYDHEMEVETESQEEGPLPKGGKTGSANESGMDINSTSSSSTSSGGSSSTSSSTSSGRDISSDGQEEAHTAHQAEAATANLAPGGNVNWLPYQTPLDIEQYTHELYPGAPISVLESHLMMAQMMIAYQLPKSAMDMLCRMMAAHLPEGHEAPKNEKAINDFIGVLDAHTTKVHRFCDCGLILEDSQLVCTVCNLPRPQGKWKNSFLEFPVEVALRKRFSDIEFLKAIRYPHQRNVQEGHLADILDGKAYKKHPELQEYGNVSFLLNTDGVSVFKSKQQEIWPLFAAINELPPNVRFKRQNLLLLGVWFGKSKPAFGTFLAPVVRRLNLLNHGRPLPLPLPLPCFMPNQAVPESQQATGGEFQCASTPSLGLPVKTHNWSDLDNPLPPEELIEREVKGFVITGVFDNPARDAVLNKQGYNAKDGCFCFELGESVPGGKRQVIVRPFKEGENLMSDLDYETAALLATESGKPVNGVKGYSPFTLLRHVGYITPIDYCHTICLGVVKKMAVVWTTKTPGIPLLISAADLTEINKRFCAIRPPSFVSRVPRSFTDRKHWKASDYRAWLVYYSPVLLRGALPDAHYAHWLRFVSAILCFLSPSISPQAMKDAKEDLRVFYKDFETLYGQRYLSINFHHLKHVASTVELFGPLWATSCFPFESANHFLRKNVHGTGHVLSQMSTPEYLMGKIPELNEQHVTPNNRELLLDMGACFGSGIYNSPSPKFSRMMAVGQDFVIGKKKKILHDTNVFFRAQIKGTLIQGTKYSRTKKRSNSAFSFLRGNAVRFGIADYFSIKSGELLISTRLLAVSGPCPLPPRLRDDFVPVFESDEVITVKASQFLKPCLLIRDKSNQLFAVQVHHQVDE